MRSCPHALMLGARLQIGLDSLLDVRLLSRSPAPAMGEEGVVAAPVVEEAVSGQVAPAAVEVRVVPAASGGGRSRFKQARAGDGVGLLMARLRAQNGLSGEGQQEGG